MHGRPHRTDYFAGRLLAMHAQHRLEIAIRRVGAAFVIAIDAQPMHLPLVDHLLLADDGNVVLGLAGDDASVAADAGVEIDAHRPGGRPFGLPAIQVRLRLVGGEKPRVLAILGKRSVPDDILPPSSKIRLWWSVQARSTWPATFCSDGASARPVSG